MIRKMSRYTLEELCEIITDGTHQTPEYCETGGYLFLSSKDVTSKKIDWEHAKHIPFELHEKLYERLKPQKNDILLAKNGTTGVAALVDRDEVFDIYVSLALLRPKSTVLPQYLFYAINSPVCKRQFDSGLKGIGVPNLHLSVIRKTEINIPSSEQQRIICIQLDKLTRIIDYRTQQLQALDDLVKARFVEMFGDPVHNTKRLPSLPMTEVCDIIDGDRGKNYPKQEEFFDKEYCLFLNAKNVTNHGFDFSECMFISKEKDSALRKGKLQRGDIVLTTRGTLGNLAFYTDEVPYENVRINSGMVILRMNRGIIDEGFFIEQFRMLVDNIKESIASGTAQPQLPISTMNKIKIVMPDMELQRRFTSFTTEIGRSKVYIKKALDETQMLFDSLMQEYFG